MMNQLETLTPREQDVLVGVTAGQSNVQIANELGLSEKRITNSLTMIFHKLGVQSRTEAAVLVLIQPYSEIPLVARARARATERLGGYLDADDAADSPLPSLHGLAALDRDLRRPGVRIADVTRGTDNSSVALARRYPEARVYGVAFSAEAIRASLIASAGPAGGDSTPLGILDSGRPADAGRYHAVFLCAGIHDLSRPVDLLIAARKSLVSGGSVVVLDRPGRHTQAADSRRAGSRSADHGKAEFGHRDSDSRDSDSRGAESRNIVRMYARSAGLARIDALPLGPTDPRCFYRLRSG